MPPNHNIPESTTGINMISTLHQQRTIKSYNIASSSFDGSRYEAELSRAIATMCWEEAASVETSLEPTVAQKSRKSVHFSEKDETFEYDKSPEEVASAWITVSYTLRLWKQLLLMVALLLLLTLAFAISLTETRIRHDSL